VSSTTADAVVVGSGVIGSAIALELARAGRRVVVADRGTAAGHGTTSASSGIIRFDYSTPDGVALAWESARCWAAWGEHLDAPPGLPLARYHRTGAISFDVPIAPRDRTRELYRQAGVTAEDWAADDLRRAVPAMNPARFWPPRPVDDPGFLAEPDGELRALHAPDGGYIEDPLLATQNLADAARACGVRFAWRSDVAAVLRSADRASGVMTAAGDTIHAPVVVNAAGPWSGRLNRLAGVGRDFTISVRPLRVEVHQVPAPAGYGTGSRPGPMVGDLDLGIYLRSAPGGVMLVGGTEPACDELDWADDPDAVDYTCTSVLYDRHVLRAARRFPGLAIPTSPTGIVGVYDVARDWIPVYDKTSGNQFKNAPVAGQLMAALIAAEEAGADHDTQPVQFDAVHTGNRINLAAFSRRREPNPRSSGTVLG
jgi:glycine/D-amino acid oxidase-like deaminating enzyme